MNETIFYSTYLINAPPTKVGRFLKTNRQCVVYGEKRDIIHGGWVVVSLEMH